MKKVKRNCFTLLEIMMVIFIIGLIAGIVGYNMKGSLDKAKEFKTKQSIEKVTDILLLEYAQNNASLDEIINNPVAVLQRSQLVKNPSELMKDGWNDPLNVVADPDNVIKVTSRHLDGRN